MNMSAKIKGILKKIKQLFEKKQLKYGWKLCLE